MVIISIIILTVYLGTIIYEYKVIPDSISGTVYMTNKPMLFLLTMWGVAFFTMISMIEKTDTPQWVAFLSTASIFGVGCTPLYRTEGGVIHYACAIIGAIGTQVIVAINAPALLFGWLLYLPYILFFRSKNWLFWAQIICISITFIYCLK